MAAENLNNLDDNDEDEGYSSSAHQKADHDDHGGHGGHEEEGEEGEPWLVSYADMMTLLFGFFVLMYSFEVAKNADKDNMVKMRKEIATFFGGEFVKPLEHLAEEFKKSIHDKEIMDHLEVQVTPEGLEISVESKTIFERGSARLTPQAREVIEMLANLLTKKGEIKNLIVEGHTDDAPVGRSSLYASNWSLSGARSTGVVEIFAARGFNPQKMYAIAYGESRPKAPNRDEAGNVIPENQAKNRRVVIKVALDESSAIDLKDDMRKIDKKGKNADSKASEKKPARTEKVAEEAEPATEPVKKEDPPKARAPDPAPVEEDSLLQDAIKDAEAFDATSPKN